MLAGKRPELRRVRSGLVSKSVAGIFCKAESNATDRSKPKRRLPVLAIFLTLITIFDFSVSAQENSPTSFDNFAKSAAAAREAGDSEEAIRDYRSAVAIRADWQEGWWYLGILQYNANHFSDAIPALKKVVELNPNLSPAWSLLGLCEFETREYENSLEHLQKGQDLGSDTDPEITRVSKYHLGLLLVRNGKFDRAVTVFSAAFGDQPPAQVKTAMGLALLRVPLLPEEVDPTKDALVTAAGETAALMLQGDSAKTMDSFGGLLKEYPNIPYLHHAFAVFLATTGRNEEALLEEQQELRASPKSALPYLEINSLELRQGHLQKALEAAQKAVPLDPNNSATHRALAKTLDALGQKSKAAAEYRALDSLPPEKPVREARLLEMYGSQANVSQALSTQTSSVTPDFSDISQEAAASLGIEKSDNAIQIYQRALQLHPEWDEGWWKVGMLSYSAGDYRGAIAALKVCAQRSFGGGTTWAVLGLSEFEIKDYDNALIHLERGHELGMSGSAESVQLATYRLAILLNQKGQFEKANPLLDLVANSSTLAKESQFALGMNLLRIPLMPEQVETSKRELVLAAGEIAALLQESKYDEALPKFKTLLRNYPAVSFLHYAYGTALADLSQYDEAESQLRQEITISPGTELPYIRLAEIALKTRRPADALPLAQRAVQLKEDSAEAHYLLGRSLLESGQDEKAVHELENAARMSPDSPEVHFNLAKAYARTNLTQKAEDERATFTRLNAEAEQKRSQSGSQSYSGSHENIDISHSGAVVNQPEQGARY